MKRKKIIIASTLIVVCLAIIATAFILGNNSKLCFHSIKRMLLSDDETGYSYTVNFLDKETHMTINPSKEDETHTSGDVIQAEDEVVDIYGFEFDSADVDSITIGENSEENIINLFYTRKASSVIVHHCLVGEETKLADDEEVPGLVGDYYEVYPNEELISQSKYNIINNPSDRYGYFEEDVKEITFLYEPVEGTVNVSYVNENGDSIADDDIITGLINSPYKVSPKDITGYECVETNGDEKGYFGVSKIEIEYTYKSISNIEINYLDKEAYDEAIAENPDLYQNGEIPLASILEGTTIVEGMVGDNYTCKPLNIEGYEVVEGPNESVVEFTKETKKINYFYSEVTSGVLEKHVDIVNGTLLQCTTLPGNVGDPYSTSVETFNGYTPVTNQQYVDKTGNTLPSSVTDMDAEYIPENASDNISDDLTEVVYYYIRSVNYEVKYVELHTETELMEDSTVAFDNANGTFTIDGTIDASYSFRGFEGDDYSTDLKDISSFTPAKNKDVYSEMEINEKGLNPEESYIPQNANGTVTISKDGDYEQTITYYYTVRAFGATVEYKNIYTDEVIEQTLVQGNFGESYGTNLISSIDGLRPATNEEYYRIKGLSMPANIDPDAYYIPDNNTGNLPFGEEVVTYYYVRPMRVIAEYIDVETKEEIPAYLEDSWYENGFNSPNLGDGFPSRVIINGIEGDPYTTKPKRFENYEDVIIAPINASGIMTAVENPDGTYSSEIHVLYVYARYSGDVTVIHYDIENDQTIEEDILYGGVGTTYVAEPLDDDTYVLAKNSDVYTPEQLSELGLDPDEDYHPVNERGLFKTEHQDVTFYYKSAPEVVTGTGKVLVKYVDFDDSDNVLYTLESQGNVGEEYVSRKLEFDGYESIKNRDYYSEDEIESLGLDPEEDYIPENYRVNYLNGEQEIVYYYRKTTEPTNPDDPDSPTNPDDPDSPTNPDNPDSPTNPDDPDSPTNPDDPDSPTNPDNPDSPTNPDDLEEVTENITNNYYTTNNYYNTTNNYYNTINNNYPGTAVVPSPGTTVVVGTTDNGSGTTSGSKVTVTDGDVTSKGGETVSSSAAKTPSTGDTLPVIAVGTMIVVVIANIVASFIKRDKKEE